MLLLILLLSLIHVFHNKIQHLRTKSFAIYQALVFKDFMFFNLYHSLHHNHADGAKRYSHIVTNKP